LQVPNKQQQKKAKYTTYLNRESAEVFQVQYTSQQIISRRKLRTVYVSAAHLQRIADESTCFSRESAEES
jgi:hypothetical protein